MTSLIHSRRMLINLTEKARTGLSWERKETPLLQGGGPQSRPARLAHGLAVNPSGITKPKPSSRPFGIGRQKASPKPPVEKPDRKTGIFSDQSPWEHYEKLVNVEQGGPVVGATKKRDHTIVAVKQIHQISKEHASHLLNIQHRNVVQLYEV